MNDPNSLLRWYPKIKDLEIPQPKTMIIERPAPAADVDLAWVCGNVLWSTPKQIQSIKNQIRSQFEYPIFMRTDKLSAKHDWFKTCFVESEAALEENIAKLVEASLNCDMIGKPVEALVFREYITMDSSFKAFGGLPISRERRYFVDNGDVICHHPYWIEDAIEFFSWVDVPEPTDWKDMLRELNTETESEIRLLTLYAAQVSQVLDGYWSVDFCRSENCIWYLIDCAKGEASWHLECPKAKDNDPMGWLFEKGGES